MYALTTIRWKWGARLLAVLAALLLAGGSAALAATLPAATGTLVGSTRTFDLWAKASSTTLPNGAVVSVWGYTDSAGGTVLTPGGPMLIANQGETVVVNLTNMLPEGSGILFQGQDMVPDTAGATANGGTKSYTFTVGSPGTFLYEAGLLPNAQHQAAMGLYGALIVRPAAAPNQAYADPATTFDDEVLLVVSEVDPAVSISPAGFDLRNYAPRYFLINGKPYPNTDPIPSTAGNRILFRYVNAGLQHHSMALLGLRQKVVAKDASPLPTGNVAVVAEPLAPGQTADGIVTVPAAATTASKFAVYDGSLMLHNNGAPGFGGMLTFVTAGAGSADTGPTTSGVGLTPNPTNGSVDVALSASASDVASGNSNVVAAEYFIDSTGAAGTGLPMSGTFGSPTVAVGATISVAQLVGLSSGKHTVYVHGQDANSNWGAFGTAVLNLDKTGPVTSGLTLTPNPSSGSVTVVLSGTGNDSTTGNGNVAAAEYTIDGGAPVAMTMGGAAAPVRSASATLAAATVNALSEGPHVVSMRSQDALSNWGAPATINLVVDKTGPTTSGVTATPNPNNGALPLSSTNPVVRVTATFSDALANIAAAEGFIDTVGATGTGFPLIPSDAAFNSPSENGYVDIPLTTINALSAGNHTIYVHGKDAAGNWGPTNTTVLVIDKTAPTISVVTLTPSTMVFGTASTQLSVSATDTGTGVSGGQYWIDGTATPPAGAISFAGTTATINTSTLAAGVHTVYVRARDGVPNWSAVSSATLTVIQAVNDTRTISANTNATQTSDANATAGVLTNDQPIGLAGRAARLASAPVRTSGTGLGTITVTCPAALGTAATPAIGGNTVCTNGAYRVTLNGVGGSGNDRRTSKLGTYQFTYVEIVNSVTSTATVTINVN